MKTKSDTVTFAKQLKKRPQPLLLIASAMRSYYILEKRRGGKLTHHLVVYPAFQTHYRKSLNFSNYFRLAYWGAQHTAAAEQ